MFGGEMPDASGHHTVSTAYTLLFLARGRHPVMMNKLRFNGNWANRPRDVANLTRFATRELERPLNWQVVSIDRDWWEWLDAPILYLASHEAIKLTDAECGKLRQYAEAGGLILTQSDGTSEAFNLFLPKLVARVFPNLELSNLPPGHDIYSMVYSTINRPPLKYVSNGARVMWVHSAVDISQYWQFRAELTKRPMFELGTNLFVYAAGKKELRNRLDTPYIPAPALEPPFATRIARLQYAGGWNPEPYAFTRFHNWFVRETGYGLGMVEAPMKDLRREVTPIAHLTGVAAYTPTDAEAGAVRQFLNDGGVLLIDACGGRPRLPTAWKFSSTDSRRGPGHGRSPRIICWWRGGRMEWMIYRKCNCVLMRCRSWRA